MTTHNEVRLKNHIRDNGEVSITIVSGDNDEHVEDKTFTNFDEAKSEIEGYENDDCTVYF